MKHRILLFGAVLLVALILGACSTSAPPAVQTPQVVVTVQACPTNAPAPACPTIPTQAVVTSTTSVTASVQVPFQDLWAKSAHADAHAMAFNDWNDTQDKKVPADCSRCHTTTGYQDYVGADGSTKYKVDQSQPIGQVIACVACHNVGTSTLVSVTMPSGAVLNNLGPEARCMVCHQGRSSTPQVDAALKKANLDTDVDKVSPDLGFINIHYFAAAATLYGTQAQGGYQYAGKSYEAKFDHVAGFNTCVGCHNPHSLQVRIDQCAGCHKGVATVDDLKKIRMQDSLVDYNGNGDVTEGVAAEIAGLQKLLMQDIQAYAKEKAGKAIAYSADSYPYFFIDTNGNGQVDKEEADAANKYNAFTARLLRAAYNYQTSIKDPGAFAHNSHYIIQLLYDSIDDLNQAVTAKVDLTNAHRDSAGHFLGAAEAFRHWDSEPSGMVPATCSKCHAAMGLPTFLANGVTIAEPTSNGLNCATCHDDLVKFTRFQVKNVKFPSGAVLDMGDGDSNLCINCHQGRESKVSLDNAINATGVKDDEVSDKLAFRNPHYFATAATLFGTQAKGAYEYNGQKYDGRNLHVEAFNACIECHDVHALNVKTDKCANCHAGVKTQADLVNVRNPNGDTNDYDGDGNVTEGIGVEVSHMRDALFVAMTGYITKTKGMDPIVYDAAAYPYFYADKNANGVRDPDEKAYTTWTPRLLRAAYNYQWVTKDPGAFAHNGFYIMQILYDSIKDLGGNVSKMVRPPVVAPPPAATSTTTP